MAKRGIDEHPKVIDFADCLGIPVCFAIGPLELFWHWVAKYRPQGDISGVKASAIAHAIRFPNKAQELLDALIEAGLVDVLSDGRVLVHDWSEHADNSVHQLLKKKGLLFSDGSEPFTRNRAKKVNDSQTVHEQEVNSSRLPEPEPEPEEIKEKENAGEAFAGAGYWRPPSQLEVAEFFSQVREWPPEQSAREAGEFCDHYGSLGWKSGHTKITDWKLKAKGWTPKPSPQEVGKRQSVDLSQVPETEMQRAVDAAISAYRKSGGGVRSNTCAVAYAEVFEGEGIPVDVVAKHASAALRSLNWLPTAYGFADLLRVYLPKASSSGESAHDRKNREFAEAKQRERNLEIYGVENPSVRQIREYWERRGADLSHG